MKIRIFKRLIAGVFEATIWTEDWSENDKSLMVKFGEPKINLGGEFTQSILSSSSESSSPEIVMDDHYVRIMSESPFKQRFDSRDYGSVSLAKYAMLQWSTEIEDRISESIIELRSKENIFTTEEVVEI